MASFDCVPVAAKVGVLNAIVGHTFKMALYGSSASLDANTAAYTATGEVSGANYSAGGVVLTGAAVVTDGATVILTFADATFANVTLTARYALIYDTTDANRAYRVLDFGSDKTKVAANLVVQMPPANATYGLIRLIDRLS